MRKKMAAAVAAVCVCVCVAMAGCSGTKEGPGTGDGQAEETETESEKETETEAAKSSASHKDIDNAQKDPDPERTESGSEEEYIFPESDTRLLTAEDLKGVPTEKLRLARNEIFARHGRLFTSPELQEYFDAKEWYEGSMKPEDFSDSMLSEIERENINLIKAREAMGDILDAAAVYKKIMDENELFGWNGLLDLGHIEVAMSGNYTDWYPALTDRGSYYEAEDQVLSVPIYYDWDYIENIKVGDKLTLTFGMSNEEAVYTVRNILQEHGREAKVISVFAPGQYGEVPLVFTDVFDNGKYALAVVDEVGESSYLIWNSDDISCACETLYRGSFYLSKDCVIDVAGEMRTVEDQWELDWETNPFGGAIFGDIIEVDENGFITRIRQQVAG